MDESSIKGDVNQVKAIERKSYLYGYGSDARAPGTADTVGILK